MYRSILIILALLTSQYSFSQILEPVKWSFNYETISDQEYDLIFTATMEKGWTVYSQFTSPEDGPVPTEIFFETEGFELIGEGIESGNRKEGIDKFFDVNVIKFLHDQDFVIRQRIKLEEGTDRIAGFVSFMTCDDTKCLPPTDVEFTFSFGTGAGSGIAIGGFDINASITGGSNILTPVKWQYEIEKLEGDEYLLRYTATADEGWSIYSQFIDGDDGPIPTHVYYDKGPHFEVIDTSVEKGNKKTEMDPYFGMILSKFLHDQPYILEHRLKVNDPTQDITGGLEYMTCDDAGCIPGFIEVTFNPVNLTGSEKKMTSEEISEMILAGQVVDNIIPSIRASLDQPIGDCGGGQKTSTNLLITFFFGFIGGLLALLTPCVFPMIPLTVSFFTKDNKRKGWVNGAIYGISIIIIYVSLGIFLTAFFGEDALNRLSTNWIANTIFFLIFIFFAFSFFGYYEITLPSSWTNKSDKMADKGGFIGIFFMAFTLALVSFSCTGPIIGSAIVESASSKLGPTVVMTGFALALAIPFGFFAAFPSWLNTLPKSGSWMTSVKVILGFLELALAFKFLSVADMTNHWGFLRYEIFMGIWVIIAILMVLYLLGYIRFPHDAPLKKIKPVRWGFIAFFAVTVVYLLSGFRLNERTQAYDSKPLLSGIAPPAHYSFFLPEPELNADLAARFSSYDKCANNLDCFKDYYEGVNYAKEVNKPIFLDFTGYGCVNCRKTEEHIWVKDEVFSKLKNDYVLVSLYCDDDQKLDETLISKSRNEKLRDVGKMWTDFQIVNFESNAQPLYVLMTPDEQLLSAPRGYEPSAKSYIEFLECGLENFEKVNSAKVIGINQ